MTLKEMRENKGLKQSELAELSGVNLRSLQDYEQGHKSLASAKGETLLRLGYALGCSMEDLLHECTLDIEPSTSDLSAIKKRISAYAQNTLHRKALSRTESLTIKFGEIRKYLDKISPVSVCMYETLTYENFNRSSEIPDLYNKFYVYGIGMINEDFKETLSGQTGYQPCIEVLLSERPREYVYSE